MFVTSSQISPIFWDSLRLVKNMEISELIKRRTCRYKLRQLAAILQLQPESGATAHAQQSQRNDGDYQPERSGPARQGGINLFAFVRNNIGNYCAFLGREEIPLDQVPGIDEQWEKDISKQYGCVGLCRAAQGYKKVPPGGRSKSRKHAKGRVL